MKVDLGEGVTGGIEAAIAMYAHSINSLPMEQTCCREEAEFLARLESVMDSGDIFTARNMIAAKRAEDDEFVKTGFYELRDQWVKELESLKATRDSQ